MRGACLLLLTLLALPSASADFVVHMQGPVHARAAAVGEVPDGRIVGILADVHVTVSRVPEGTSGGVFLDTRPLLLLDMQGSARIAARVASELAGARGDAHDVFVALRSESALLGGPSAGALLSVLMLAAMTNHTLKEDVVLTGTVLPDGSIGPVGGVPEKAAAAARGGARVFLYPAGQEVVPAGGGAAVDMESYCVGTLKVTCVPVGTVAEAFAYLTGFRIERTPVGVPVGGERSAAVLAEAAGGLVANATRLRHEAAAVVANTTFTGDVGAYVSEVWQRTERALAAARLAHESGQYYTASSKAFQASVDARAIVEIGGWARSADGRAYLDGAIGRAAPIVEAAASAAAADAPRTVSQLQALGAAQTRAREASRLLQQARAEAFVPEALRLASFAVERSRTVHWWLEIGRQFLDTPEADAKRVEETSTAAIEAAGESIAYARALFGETGSRAMLAEPERLLAEARQERERGFHGSALFTALEADVRAGLLFAATPSGIPNASLDRARESAVRAVATSRLEGTEPILAVSYLEFAGSLRNETNPETVEAYVFYQLARLSGNLPEVLARADGSRGPTRFAPFVDNIPRLTAPASWFPAYFVLGLATGAVAALLLLNRGRER